MSFLTKLPKAFYCDDAFDGFTAGRDFTLADGRAAMIWISRLADETDEPAKIEDLLGSWGLRLANTGPDDDAVVAQLLRHQPEPVDPRGCVGHPIVPHIDRHRPGPSPEARKRDGDDTNAAGERCEYRHGNLLL